MIGTFWPIRRMIGVSRELEVGLDDVYGHGLFRTVDGGSTWHRVPLE